MDDDLESLNQMYDARSELVRQKIKLLQDLNEKGVTKVVGSSGGGQGWRWDDAELVKRRKEAEDSVRREAGARRAQLQSEITLLQSQAEMLRCPQKVAVIVPANAQIEYYKELLEPTEITVKYFIIPASSNRETLRHTTVPRIASYSPLATFVDVQPTTASYDKGGASIIPYLLDGNHQVAAVVHGGDPDTHIVVQLGCRLILKPPLKTQAFESLLRRLRESQPPPSTPPRTPVRNPPTKTPPIPAPHTASPPRRDPSAIYHQTPIPSPGTSVSGSGYCTPVRPPLPGYVVCEGRPIFNERTEERKGRRRGEQQQQQQPAVSGKPDEQDKEWTNTGFGQVAESVSSLAHSNVPGGEILVKVVEALSDREAKWKEATTELLSEVAALKAELKKANDLNDALMDKIGRG
eukprot:TRINITY_DN21714_c0_g1_i1.p1 TRINITY_DN21714_c0_g1~~TRINITY_DN21714_c0_g1_i1.p1  ORF type:complete len:429 (+),score=81.95 TRINITY_DN21714_c0_g1_i1:69-1289(+)